MKLWYRANVYTSLSTKMGYPDTSDSPAGSRRRGLAIGFGVVGVLIVAFGWLIPSQFKSIPLSILAGAGENSPDLARNIREHLDAGRPGAAAVLADAAKHLDVPNADLLHDRVAEYTRENPDLAIWGEANPYLTNALTPEQLRTIDPAAGVIRHFLPAAARKSLLEYLSSSRNAATRAVIATRDLRTYQQFLPVVSAGGAPLEASILLAGMLVQSDALGDDAIMELRKVAEQAVRTGDTSRLEATYLDVLALGRRYNFGQLTAILRGVRTLETISELRHLGMVAPDSISVIAASAIITHEPDEIARYLIEYGEHGMKSLTYALYHGEGSLRMLLRQQLPTDGDLDFHRESVQPGLWRTLLDRLTRFALQSPLMAVVVKIAAYLIGGLLLFLSAERITALRRIEASPVFTAAARVVGALTVCLLLVIINEPYLALGSQPSGYELRLVIPVIGTSTPASTMSDKASAIDLPTIVSIVFFFLVQALVFTICRLKLKDIEARRLSPAVKLRLAENEENLFDSGLYVGIAGTCISLVLQVMHVIQANLLAAYSSNLFGILCVAFIKIRHVRPFKQKLILELTEATEEVATVASKPNLSTRAG